MGLPRKFRVVVARGLPHDEPVPYLLPRSRNSNGEKRLVTVLGSSPPAHPRFPLPRFGLLTRLQAGETLGLRR